MSELTPLYGLDNWVNYLEANPVPVRSSIQRKLLKLINRPSTTTAKVIAFVKQDPALAFHVVRQAQRLHNQKKSHVTGIEHAVNSMGFDNLKKLVTSLPTVKVSPQALSHRLFFRSCANSLAASELTRAWLTQKSSVFIEDGQLAGLFNQTHEWVMWLYAPVHMANIYKKVHEQGQANETAEVKELGCKLTDIAQALNKRWEMPLVVQESISQEGPMSNLSFRKMFRLVQSQAPLGEEDNRQLGLALQDKYFAAALANQLANSLQSGAYFNQQQNLLELASYYLKRELDTCRDQVIQQLINTSRRFHVIGSLSPAAELLFIRTPAHQTLAFDYTITQQELTRLLPNYPAPGYKTTAVVTPAKKSSKGSGDQAKQLLEKINRNGLLANQGLFEKVLHTLQTNHGNLSSKQILQYVIKSLHEGLGADRLIVHRAQGNQLKHLLSYGLEESDKAQNYVTPVPETGLFNKLTTKAGIVWVNADNHTAMLRLIPKNYHSFMGHQGNMFISLNLGDGKFAIIHLYRSNTVLSVQDHKACLLLFNHARSALAA